MVDDEMAVREIELPLASSFLWRKRDPSDERGVENVVMGREVSTTL